MRPEDVNPMIGLLNSRFQTYGRENFWSVHTWDYSGYDYGFDLLYNPVRELWTLRTMEDSGYGSSKVILETDDSAVIWRMAECFEPTNPNFKTQRK